MKGVSFYQGNSYEQPKKYDLNNFA